MTNTTDTPAEARELPSGLRCNLDGAIGGTYRLPDGREFWMDAAAVREIMARIEPVIASWMEAPPVEMVERVARAIARATVLAAEPEKTGRLSDGAIDALVENLAVKFYPEARAALAAASPDDRLRVAREALGDALDMIVDACRDGTYSLTEFEQLKHILATLGEPAQSGETK